MATSLTVPKTLNYPPGMDYQLLRREGMRYLERLGSGIWTDFNAHDPGVTMLEVLCYALTDLGYRTQLPDADLFIPVDNRKAFFTAAKILPNAPVTALDFRKILIDIEGVKNAWLEGCGKPTVYFNWMLDREINLQIPDLNRKGLKEETFDPIPPFNLKTFKLTLNVPESSPPQPKEYTIEEYLQTIYQLKPAQRKTPELHLRAAIGDQVIKEILPEQIKKYWLLLHAAQYLHDAQKWVSVNGITDQRIKILKELGAVARTLKFVEYNADNADTDIAKRVKALRTSLTKKTLLEEVLKDPDFARYFFAEPVWPQLMDGLSVKPTDSPSPYSLFKPKGIYKVYLQLEDGFEYEKNTITEQALKRLHENRALSEDFEGITVVDKARVCVHTQIEIAPDADPVQVYADLRYTIENFLAPPVPMYGLQEMLDRHAAFTLTETSITQLTEAELPDEILQNLLPLQEQLWIGIEAWRKAVTNAVGQVVMDDYEGLLYQHTIKTYESDEVFQGPLLRHGFIGDAELANASWRRVVYKSDLFQVLSATKNVVRVTRLQIHKSPKNDENDDTVEKEWCLSFDCDCQPTLDPECSEFTFTVNGRPVRFDIMDQYEAIGKLEQLRAQDAKIDRTGNMDLPVPRGTQRPDLDEYVSIQEEFPRTYHVGREGIASSHPPLRKAQVKQMKGFLMFFDQILANYLAHLAEVRNMLATDMTVEKQALYQALYDVPNVQPLLMAFDESSSWEDFKKDPENGYLKALHSLTNGSDTSRRLRQNKIIDHLLARFGEQFTDHALRLFEIEQPLDDDGENDGSLADWLEDKQKMLRKLPGLGRRRGQGFNYRPAAEDDYRHFWDSDNEVGFKRRVLAQMGVEDWRRRTITCSPRFYTDTRLETGGRSKRYRFGIKKDENASSFWLLSTALYSREENASHAADDFYARAADINQYGIVRQDKDYFAGFWNGNDPRTRDNALLISSPKNEMQANLLLSEIKNYIARQCQVKSFYVIEHILLRPADEYYVPLKPVADIQNFSQSDPYSFRITVIVPNWVGQFLDPLFEELVRSEVPAHVAIHFVRIDHSEMLDFEPIYFEWLKAKTDPETSDFHLREATNMLVEELNKKR
ncbi:hypothetical protein SAMN05216327_102135 [Dyadobacter sp. SG02]|uniref:hypothetical protein n=1 Tax=Dyadobacter sp. SG02 TaxID=1855291 RepID=UPI0008B3E826|nr:hypothetical protein [Dyadobacter sp. SG02]SEI51266.1 hypothetical protein SAMN05216327_102135 [Dyadobacter sp. SG02]